MQLYAGTSGYSYKEWLGRFYPQKLPANAMLRKMPAETDAEERPAVRLRSIW